MFAKLDKIMLEKLMNEVVESGTNKKIPLSSSGYLELEFDMLEYKRDLYPVCNIYLFGSDDTFIKNLFVTRIEKGQLFTEGSINEVFKVCESFNKNNNVGELV